jgi:hypothetical protein
MGSVVLFECVDETFGETLPGDVKFTEIAAKNFSGRSVWLHCKRDWSYICRNYGRQL